MHRRTVFITACEDRRTFPWSGKVKLPDSWAHDALAFEAVRSSKEEAQGEAQLNESQRRRQQAQESNQNSYPTQ
jgi:hypothetical protein